MLRKTKLKVALACLVGTLALGGASQTALAQAPGGGGPGGGGPGGPGGPGGFDPAQFRQRMMDALKTQMNATDDEWKVLQPLIEKVQEAQRDTRGGFGGFGRGGPGGGGPGGGGGGAGANASPVQQAASEVRAAMQDTNTSAQEIGRRMAAYREAREKARQKLAAAQKDLKDVLTQRQEAALLMFGLIE